MGSPGRIERDNWVSQARFLHQAQLCEAQQVVAAEAAKKQAAAAEAGKAQATGVETAKKQASASDVVTSQPAAVVAAGAAAAAAGAMSPPAAGDVNAAHPGQRPASIAQARYGKPDDLKKISGIGPQNEQKLNGLGIYHFDQIARWSAPEAQWIGSFMAFPGRIEREDWVGQAKLLVSGQETDFSRRIAAEQASEASAADAPSAPGGTMSGGIVPAASAVATVTAAVFSAEELSALDGKFAGKRPVGLAAPRGGEPDDLLKIRGVGKANLQQLHALGIFHFDQITKWSKEELRWVGSYMAFPGRLEKEDWIGQAKHYAQRRAIELANRAASGKKS